MYYNKDAFAAAGLEVPTTLDEFEDVLDAFVAQGVTPLAEAAAEYPLGQLWYQLALTKADREFVNDYQLYENPVDWSGRRDHLRDRDRGGLVRQGLHRSDRLERPQGRGRRRLFINGDYPIFVSGSWWYRPLRERDHRLRLGHVPASPRPSSRPARRATCGSCPRTRRTRSSPTSSSTSRCAPRSRRSSATTAASPWPPTRPTSPTRRAQELIATFNALTDKDGLSFYPDWPTPTFYDELNAGLQELVNGTKSPADVQQQLGEQYDAGVAGLRRLIDGGCRGRTSARGIRPSNPRKEPSCPKPSTRGPRPCRTPATRSLGRQTPPAPQRPEPHPRLQPERVLALPAARPRPAGWSSSSIPLVWNVYLTFTKWRGIRPPEWIGLDNWIELLGDEDFWTSFGELHLR